ncbi:MAG: DUF3136 domain-containing protein [Vulcanococcus sp.]
MDRDGLTAGQLKGNNPLYCKAMRILVRDGISLAKARRTHCWHRLELLHHALPRQYREPEQLYKLLQRDLLAKASA